MTWQPDPRTGWGRVAERIGARTLLVLRSVLQVAPGGIIRFGKTAYADDTHRGFWIGVDGNGAVDGGGAAKLNIGGPDRSLKWTGSDLVIRGAFYTPTVAMDESGLALREGDGMSNRLRYVTAEGEDVAALHATADGGPWVSLATAQPAPAENGRLDLEVDGDFGANVRLRLETTKGSGAAASRMQVQVGNQTRIEVDGAGRLSAAGGLAAGGQRISAVADAAADDDALNRRTGDDRYLAQAAGWTGSLAVGSQTVSVVDGQITSVV